MVNIKGSLIAAKVQSVQSFSLKRYLSKSLSAPSENPIHRLKGSLEHHYTANMWKDSCIGEFFMKFDKIVHLLTVRFVCSNSCKKNN